MIDQTALVPTLKYALARIGDEKLVVIILICVTAVKLLTVNAGDPFLTVDDITAFDGGFLVWFGYAPPQRMYLESWFIGLVCVALFFCKVLLLGIHDAFTLDFLTHAYRDFYTNPESYVYAYRAVIILLDAGTAFAVYRICGLVFGRGAPAWILVLPASIYALTYNTLWSDLVIRPDALTAFFATVGLYLYLKSDYGKVKGYLWAGAIVLGCAAGMKLHAAIIAVVLTFDLLRVQGAVRGLRIAVIFSAISFAIFLVTSGTALFDPALYLKLRALNYAHDLSPTIGRFDQVSTILKGSNWLTIPLSLFGAILLFRSKSLIRENQKLFTILLLTVVWILIFVFIRQLRAYWMLPALPGLFILATFGLSKVRQQPLRVGLGGFLIAITLAGFVNQFYVFKTTPYKQVTTWLRENADGKTVFILGFDSLPIPRNSRAANVTVETLKDRVDLIGAEEQSFLRTHVRSWEERAMIRKLQMLGGMDLVGLDYYTFHTTPPDLLFDRLAYEDLDIVVVQSQFDRDTTRPILAAIGGEDAYLGTFIGPGGGGEGLRYRVYVNRSKSPSSESR